METRKGMRLAEAVSADLIGGNRDLPCGERTANTKPCVAIHGSHAGMADQAATLAKRLAQAGWTVMGVSVGNDLGRLAVQEANLAGGRAVLIERLCDGGTPERNGFAGHVFCRTDDGMAALSSHLSQASVFMPGDPQTVWRAVKEIIDKRKGTKPLWHRIILVGNFWRRLVEQLQLAVKLELMPEQELAWFQWAEDINSAYRHLIQGPLLQGVTTLSPEPTEEEDTLQGFAALYVQDMTTVLEVLGQFRQTSQLGVLGSGSTRLDPAIFQYAHDTTKALLPLLGCVVVKAGGMDGVMRAAAMAGVAVGTVINFPALIKRKPQPRNGHYHHAAPCHTLDVRERAILGAVLGPNVATVAFPGGAGTVREAFLPGAGKVVFANRQGYWELTRRFADEMAEVGLMSAAEREALIFVEDPLDAFRGD